MTMALMTVGNTARGGVGAPANLGGGRRSGGLARCVRAELMKLRRSPIWLAFVVGPALSCVIGVGNYVGNLQSAGGVLTPGWANLWTQETIFLCYFVLPALAGAACSFEWRLEHQGSNWNELMVAPVSPWCVVVAKFVMGALCMAVAFVAIAALYVASGLALGLADAFPVGQVASYLVAGWLGSLAIVAIQLGISMVVRSFAAPVGIAFGLGVVGLLATMGGYGLVFPYSLVQAGMASNTVVTLGPDTVVPLVVASVGWTAAAVLASCAWLRRVDVRA